MERKISLGDGKDLLTTVEILNRFARSGVRIRYQVLVGSDWMDVKKAQVQQSDWLHWQTVDEHGEVDEIGLTQSGKWRFHPSCINTLVKREMKKGIAG